MLLGSLWQGFRRSRAGSRGRRRGVVAGVLSFLLVAGCGPSGTGEPVAAQVPLPVKVARVSTGGIASTLSYAGQLQAAERVDILPAGSGRVQQIFVAEGEEVRAGAPLASLETDILDGQVQQAEAGVQAAQAKLDQVLQGAKPEEIAAAQAQLEVQRARLAALAGETGAGAVSVARANATATGAKAAADQIAARAGVESAQAALASAEAKLHQLRNPAPQDIEAAHAAVTSAGDAVASARSKLEQLRNPAAVDIEAAEAAMLSAQGGLRSAEAQLAELREGPRAQELSAAEAAVANAEAALRQSERARVDLRRGLNEGKMKELFEAYFDVQEARDAFVLHKAQGAPPEILAEDQFALYAAIARFRTAEEESHAAAVGVSVEQLIAADSALESAQANLKSAEVRLQQLKEGATVAQLQTAEAAVERAMAEVQGARVRLQKLRNPTGADLAAAEAAVTAAKAQHAASLQKLGQLQDPSAADLQAAQTAVANARASLDSAEAKRSLLDAGASAAEIESAMAAVTRAEADVRAQAAGVSQAEQQLAQVENRFTRPDIAAAAAGVAQAEAALRLAQIQRSKAVLTAPFDGVVTRRHVSPGAMVMPQSPVVSLVSGATYVAFDIEESSLGQLNLGQPATFRVSAYGDRVFRGTVTSIAPTADEGSRTFRARVTPDGEQRELRPGMFAALEVAVRTQELALLAPVEALVQHGQSTVVFVIRDGVAEQREIAVGLRNNRFAQIVTGLAEGDVVAVQGNRALRDGDRVTVVQ